HGQGGRAGTPGRRRRRRGRSWRQLQQALDFLDGQAARQHVLHGPGSDFRPACPAPLHRPDTKHNDCHGSRDDRDAEFCFVHEPFSWRFAFRRGQNSRFIEREQRSRPRGDLLWNAAPVSGIGQRMTAGSLADYQVVLDTFRGPLDLLLYLVKRDEVDILDIPIARVAEQFKSYLDVLTLIDVERAGDFLVMASTLMEIKSKL